jgi:aspartyl-tRNA(Asn)/glutamyl-tRNA(Gln) amidotransferase subunit A
MINNLDLVQAIKGLKEKSFSSVELTKACLNRIERINKELNVFITIAEKDALEQAEKADNEISSGNTLPLLGIPIALKDMFLTKGIETTAGSNVLKKFIPVYDSTVTSKLKQAGAIIIGKTNQDAWAHGSSGENSDFGPTKNPWNLEYVPGGSSSGSAVAVATDMAIAATGTDTGGSVRQPASFCNVVGLKPTYGRVSRYGIVAMASSHDSIGHFTKTVEDSAYLLRITAGHDPMDATSSENKVPDYLSLLSKPLKGLKIGYHKQLFSKGELDTEIAENYKKTVLKLQDLGAEIVDLVSIYSTNYIASYYVIQPAEVSSNLARYDGIRFGNERKEFGDEAKRRIMLGTHALSSGYYDQYYNKASQVRSALINDLNKHFFNKVDAFIAPVSPTPPWKLGEKINDPLKMYLSDIFTVVANLAGIPGLAVPTGFTNSRLPIGMQILGPQFSEERLFQIGYAFEQSSLNEDWKKLKPNL